MTETREFNAATVEGAVEKASEVLGVDPNELSYEIVDTGSAGFMGMGARDARIVVGHADTDDEPEPVLTPEDHDYSSHSEASPEIDGAAGEDKPEASEDLIQEIEAFLSPVVEAMSFDARIDVYDAGQYVAADVSTEETGLFIGQKGETIDALQYLLNVSVYRDRPFVKKIVIDSEGYRQRRIEAIQGMAHRMARRAVRERRSIELPPMNPTERRVVHLFLQENSSVTTASEGSGENRRVTVFPAS